MPKGVEHSNRVTPAQRRVLARMAAGQTMHDWRLLTASEMGSHARTYPDGLSVKYQTFSALFRRQWIEVSPSGEPWYVITERGRRALEVVIQPVEV